MDIRIDKRIAFGLRQMDRYRLQQELQISENTFDLIDHNPFRAFDHTIGAPLHRQHKTLTCRLILQRNLRMISGLHLLLDLAVNLPAHQHGVLICSRCPVVYVSAPQDKFYQIAHGYTNVRLFHVACSLPSNSVTIIPQAASICKY